MTLTAASSGWLISAHTRTRHPLQYTIRSRATILPASFRYLPSEVIPVIDQQMGLVKYVPSIHLTLSKLDQYVGSRKAQKVCARLPVIVRAAKQNNKTHFLQT